VRLRVALANLRPGGSAEKIKPGKSTR